MCIRRSRAVRQSQQQLLFVPINSFAADMLPIKHDCIGLVSADDGERVDQRKLAVSQARISCSGTSDCLRRG